METNTEPRKSFQDLWNTKYKYRAKIVIPHLENKFAFYEKNYTLEQKPMHWDKTSKYSEVISQSAN